MSRSPHDPEHELALEQRALGETNKPDGAASEDARLAALRASNEEILARYPARSVALRVRERLAAQRRRTAALLTGMLAPAAVAALLLVVVRPGEDVLEHEDPDQTTIKGQKADVQVFALKDGEPVHVHEARAGDRVQLAIVPAGAPHAALVSIDGRGGVTLHFPAGADGKTAVDARATLRLPDSFELDDAPAFERFILVTGDAPIDVAAVLAAARALAKDEDARRTAPLSLPLTLAQTARTIEKSVRSPK
jgi:hypothetical protein